MFSVFIFHYYFLNITKVFRIVGDGEEGGGLEGAGRALRGGEGEAQYTS